MLPNVTLTDVMNTWSVQKGYPLLTVERNYSSGEIYLSQRRFLEQNDTDKSLWYIPINYKKEKSQKEIKMWLETKNLTIKDFTEIDSNDWLLFNVDQTGECRKYFVFIMSYGCFFFRVLQS